MTKFLRFPRLALLSLGVALSFGTSSCSKDDSDGLKLIKHDESVYMRNMSEGMAMMEAMPKTGDPDNDYSSMMIVHHQIAIKNCQEELKSG